MAKTSLFRYSRIKRPAILDLTKRASAARELAPVLKMDSKERRAWATQVLGRKKRAGLPLSRDYLSLFKGDILKGPSLPGRDMLADPKMGDLREAIASEDFAADQSTALTHLLALKIRGAQEAAETSRVLQLLEHLPKLAAGEEPRRYVRAVLDRYQAAPPAPASEDPDPVAERDEADQKARSVANEAAQVAKDLRLLWRLRGRVLAEERKALLASDNPDPEPVRNVERPAPARKRQLPATADDLAVGRRVEMAVRLSVLRARQIERGSRLRAAMERVADGSLDGLKNFDDSRLAKAGGVSEKEVSEARRRIESFQSLSAVTKLSFCQAYEAAIEEADRPRPDGRPIRDLGHCFRETPKLDFGDEIDLLGIAELIRVDETFMHYSEGEISYIENVLAGETRVRETRATREFETVDEVSESESTTTTEETTTTTGAELSKAVSTELSTRFNSDVSASASGSGGGSVGVVDFQGEGSVSAGLGLGVDSSISSSTTSSLTNEIVEKSAETLTRTMQSRRMSRSKSVFDTFNSHTITNTPESPHRRGIYCFLDKHVCVTETAYGNRWFLRAILKAPGRSLVCDALTRRMIAEMGTDEPHAFDIGPADITPANYMSLVERFRAAGVSPPPPPVRRMARTYKTDQTNEVDISPEGLEKLGQTLLPIFKSYKRYLVTDSLTVPEGYQMQEVYLRINHGTNGGVAPLDLPLKLASAGLMAMPTMMAYGALMFPVSLWQIVMLASPFLQFNTDSSSVAATIGPEAQESLYYFFEGDMIVQELLQLATTLGALSPAVFDQIETAAADLVSLLNGQSAAMATAAENAVNALKNVVETAFNSIETALEGITDPTNIGNFIQILIDGFAGAATSVSAIANSVPPMIFQPISDFITAVSTIISEAIEGALSDLMAALIAGSENNPLLHFSGAAGATGEVPVALNMVTLKPGITVTLSACLVRSEEALAEWRLDTFNALYQAHLQQVADYESRQILNTGTGRKKSPGTMREEESRVLRERLTHALNGVKDPPDAQNAYTRDRMMLFEHGVDWANISYRLYNYGPSLREIKLDHLGVTTGADARRRAFLNAAWAQVMLPLSGEEALEQAILNYFDTGDVTIGADLTNDELAELWAEAIDARRQLKDAPEPVPVGELVLPTDHIVVRSDDTTPANTETPCA